MGKLLSSHPHVLSVVASQFIWCNEYTKSVNNTIYNRYFSQKNPLNHIGDFFEINDKMISWEDLRATLDLDSNTKSYWIQIIHTVPSAWKLTCNLLIKEHHLIN